MPVPNRGIEAAALARLSILTQALQMTLAQLPAGSDLARDIRDAVSKLAKHIPPGSFSPGVQMTEAQRQLMQQRQMGPQIAAMRGTQMSQPPGPQTPPQAPSPMAA